MALKKSELYSSLWSSCDELHGDMDASKYKDYVLALLFIKYVSDNYPDTGGSGTMIGSIDLIENGVLSSSGKDR